MANKGVLVSDSSIAAMSPVQWYFEYCALKNRERSIALDVYNLAKNAIVSILGLNLLKPVGPDGRPKSESEMSEDEKNAFLPLVAWIGHHELLKKVADQYGFTTNGYDEASSEFGPQVQDEKYEQIVNMIDAAGGDMEPILGIDVEKDAEIAQKMQKLMSNKDEPLIPDRSEIKVDI